MNYIGSAFKCTRRCASIQIDHKHELEALWIHWILLIRILAV